MPSNHRRRSNKDPDDALPSRLEESHTDPYSRLANDFRQTPNYRRADSSSNSGRNSTQRGTLMITIGDGGRSMMWQILEKWRILENLSHGQFVPFLNLVFQNESGPIVMIRDIRRLLIPSSRRGPYRPIPHPLIIGMGTKTDGTPKKLADTPLKGDHQNALHPLTALRPLTTGGIGIAVLPEQIIMLTRGTITPQPWSIVLGNPHPPGSPLGPGSVEIKTTITINLLPAGMGDAAQVPRVATTPPIEIITSLNEIGGTTTEILTIGLGAMTKD
ncbi:hypothetical protein DFH06DRAFT_1314944 [Mycena polygramma]|nr:hypothetical protein DFH06DRAFT_1314944 [Mycena polygramma]